MEVRSKLFGETEANQPVYLHRLQSESGLCLQVIDYGAAIQSLWVPDSDGNAVDVVLGYDTLAAYSEGTEYLGACIGRCANRIENGVFELNGKTYALQKNDGDNHLHGGVYGFDRKVWQYQILPDGICYTCVSGDMEEGYPGRLRASVTYRLLPDNGLQITYEAVTDKETICNLTNHSYFNLNGSGGLEAHLLQIRADWYGENNADCLTTGRLLEVENTPFDFRKIAPILPRLRETHTQLAACKGFDHAFRLCEDTAQPAAILYGLRSGVCMEVWTDQPYMQFYTANTMPHCIGKNGRAYGPFCAACFETEQFPNAMAYHGFQKPVLSPAHKYHTQTNFLFSVQKCAFEPAYL